MSDCPWNNEGCLGWQCRSCAASIDGPVPASEVCDGSGTCQAMTHIVGCYRSKRPPVSSSQENPPK